MPSITSEVKVATAAFEAAAPILNQAYVLSVVFLGVPETSSVTLNTISLGLWPFILEIFALIDL